MICVSPAHKDDFRAALESGADMLELRFDLLESGPELLFPQIPKEMKTVATCRPGRTSAGERIRILKEAIRLGADYADIEIESPAEEIAELADRIYVMEEGKISFEGDKDEALSDDHLKEIFLGM